MAEDGRKPPPRIDCDVLVAGTGAAGFTTAITARLLGLDVVMVEKAARFGGTTARSGGIPWVPGNRFGREAGFDDDAATVRTYLRHELGNRYDPDLIDAYLESGPEMIDFLVVHGAAAFKALAPFPDYHSEIEGAAMGGRAVRPLPYDGRRLGARFADLEWPIAETMMFGRMMINSEHMSHFYNAGRSVTSARFVAARVLRYVADRLTGNARGTDLSSGNALIGRFAEKALALGIPIHLGTALVDLTRDGERVTGAVVEQGGARTTIAARRGVMLATGGFSHDPALRAAHYPAGTLDWSLTTPGVAGDAARLAGEAGARIDADKAQAATWLPMSRVPGGKGQALFPHLVDRNKPGFIAVDGHARRFVNESVSYQDFVPPMIDALADAARPEVYLICDHRALHRYGIGPVRPWPVPFGKWLNNGYLVRGATLAALAAGLDLDPAALEASVARFNDGARVGEDAEFGRGTTRYQRAMGDATHRPNPSLGPLEQAPFYAVRLVPGDIGASIGLRADPDGRVLDGDGAPIAGLYAAGNDMSNPTAGVYPGAGVTLGPAMTFAWRAARRMAREQAA